MLCVGWKWCSSVRVRRELILLRLGLRRCLHRRCYGPAATTQTVVYDTDDEDAPLLLETEEGCADKEGKKD